MDCIALQSRRENRFGRRDLEPRDEVKGRATKQGRVDFELWKRIGVRLVLEEEWGTQDSLLSVSVTIEHVGNVGSG